MPFQTKLTQALGIKIPIVQGGMQWVGYAELAAAVSNAGALGILTALTQPTPEDLRKEIRRCKAMTSNPFGVNITLLPALVPPPYAEYAKVIVEEGIRIVETAGNSPGRIINQLKEAGTIILHKCTTIRHALSAIKLGVDFLSIDGFECAGHVGESDITNFILLSKARQSLSVPFIASGGFADGQGLAAALSLGAEGINMGTRFMCTVEAPIHENIKREIVKADENSTQLVMRRWKNTTRLYKNKVTLQAIKIEKDSPTGKFEEIAPLVSGKRGREVYTTGDPEHGVWTAGQVLGLIHDIPTCDELVKRIEIEAEKTLRKANALIIPTSKL
ncbi:NADH:quinone reductase [Erysiphe necator]|uniref:Putative 2-nitropropane dioxygenase n=1 Tax=Uncinula necator TaxID=52586 RepID=A0A0B1PBU9_UNCNE|nr:NADH:quinone reductase [Erysiphe necator]KHJ34144.1 putative 2-nitropropane dioxygenase [Erysiphe necator]